MLINKRLSAILAFWLKKNSYIKLLIMLLFTRADVLATFCGRSCQLGSAHLPQERALFELELRQYRRLPESPVRLKVYARADDEVPLSDEEVTRCVKGEGLPRHE